jgi:hypothetical protein
MVTLLFKDMASGETISFDYSKRAAITAACPSAFDFSFPSR